MKTIIPVIDRKELITEQDLDTEDLEDNLDSEVSLEDLDSYIYIKDSRGDYDV